MATHEQNEEVSDLRSKYNMICVKRDYKCIDGDDVCELYDFSLLKTVGLKAMISGLKQVHAKYSSDPKSPCHSYILSCPLFKYRDEALGRAFGKPSYYCDFDNSSSMEVMEMYYDVHGSAAWNDCDFSNNKKYTATRLRKIAANLEKRESEKKNQSSLDSF